MLSPLALALTPPLPFLPSPQRIFSPFLILSPYFSFPSPSYLVTRSHPNPSSLALFRSSYSISALTIIHYYIRVFPSIVRLD